MLPAAICGTGWCGSWIRMSPCGWRKQIPQRALRCPVGASCTCPSWLRICAGKAMNFRSARRKSSIIWMKTVKSRSLWNRSMWMCRKNFPELSLKNWVSEKGNCWIWNPWPAAIPVWNFPFLPGAWSDTGVNFWPIQKGTALWIPFLQVMAPIRETFSTGNRGLW